MNINIEELLSYLLLVLLIVGMIAGIICLFHFIGAATASLTLLVLLIIDLISA